MPAPGARIEITLINTAPLRTICREQGEAMTIFGAVITAVLLLATSATPEGISAPPGDRDLIIQLSGKVSDEAAADLTGDRKKDLVVLHESDPATPEGRGIELLIQEANRSYRSVKIPADWTRGAFFIDTGNFAASPGKEILVVREQTVFTIVVDSSGKPAISASDFPARSLFKAPFHDRFVFLKTSVDLDGNGLSDSVLPAPDGYIVLFCRKDGTFRDPVPISCPPVRRVVRSENASFAVITESSKVRILRERGKLPMLIMEQGGRIICRRWDKAKGRFEQMSSSDDTFGSYSGEFKVGSVEYAGTLFGSHLGNGEPTLLLSRRMGSPGLLSDLKTEHIFHTMTMNNSVVTFTRRQIIANAGISVRPTFSDIDADGNKDLILCFVKSSAISKLIDEFLDRVVMSCQVFLFNPKKKTFSYKPDWSDDFSVPADAFQTVGAEGLLILDCDFSRDRRPDLVVFEGDRLRFLRGFKDSGFFSTKKVAFKSRAFYQVGGPFPGPLFTEDLDGDGQKELVTFGKNIVRIIHVL